MCLEDHLRPGCFFLKVWVYICGNITGGEKRHQIHKSFCVLFFMLWLEKPHIRECVAGGLWLVKQMQEGSDWDPSHGLLSTWPWAKLGCGSISLPCVCTESRVSSSPGHCQGLSGQGLLGRCQRVPAKPCSQEQISKTPKGNANGLPKRNQQFLIHAAMWDGDLYLITVFFHSVRVYWEKKHCWSVRVLRHFMQEVGTKSLFHNV